MVTSKALSGAALLLLLACACSPSQQLTAACEPETTRQFTAPWQELSDSELHIEIERACGRVFIGFKEAGAVRGVDPQGRNLTTAETVSRMRSYVVDRGVVIEWEAVDLPHLVGRMPTRRELVTELRHHTNIDYVEPIFPGTYLGSR